MTDPFDALRRPAVPVDPDPRFAATLRARIGRALALPRGVAVTATAERTRAALVPYLAVPAGEGRRALDWYADVLGAELAGDPVVMPDGKIGHAELALGGATVYLAEEFPHIGVVAPRPGETSVSLSLQVPDVADTVRRATAAGGQLTRPVYDDHGSRNATVVDPFGHRWLLATPLPAPAGGVGYVWLTVPDVDRALAFWGSVLGWTFGRGHGDARTVEGRQVGIAPGDDGAFHASYEVPDVAAAVERVLAAGGRSSGVLQRAYGEAAQCADHRGVEFGLHGAHSEVADLSYVTVEVPDSAAARAFYGAVLGWRFAPGSVEDGWQVEDVRPGTGLAGGQARGAVVPMWRVDDVAAAVERVRAAGGTASDPERRPYGTIAECTDDQGVRFYVGDA